MSDDQHKISDEPPESAQRVRRVKKRHFAQAVLTGFAGLAVALIVGFIVLIGRDIEAPDWLQSQIEARIAQALPQLDVGIGQIALRIEPSDLSPRVFFQNVSVRDETGLPFASLSELSVRASFPAALRGKFLPKKISLTGALMKLRRAKDGSFDLTIGSALQASGQSGSLTELIERIDTALEQPDLSYLRDVQADSLTVLYEDARVGRAWTVDGGRMRLSRSGDTLEMGADFALLGGQDYATTLALSYSSEIGSAAAQVGMTLADAPAQDIASQTPALLWMEALRAPISGSLRTQVDETGALGPLNAVLQIGKGVVQPEDEAQPIPFEAAQAYFAYDPKRQSIRFSELVVNSAWVNLRAEGRADLIGAEQGWPEALLAQLKLTNVEANPDRLYPEPIVINQADLDMRMRFDPFRLDIGQLVVSQAGQTLVASARADVGRDGWRAGLDVRAPVIDVAEVLRIWPDRLKAKTRTWVSDNILGGDITDARLAFRMSPGQKNRLHLDFAYDKAALRFMKTMPPVEQGKGYVRIQDREFLAVVEAGRVTAPQGGSLSVGGTHFTIPDMSIKEGPAQIHLKTRGTVTGALSLLDQDPFKFLTKAGRPVQLADGQVDLEGDIGIRLKKNLPASEIEFDVAGEVTGVRSTTLVPGRVVASDRLSLRAQTAAITLEGAGRIDAVPASGRWRLPLGAPGLGSQLVGQVELSERFVDAFKIGLPAGTVSGKGQGQITIDLKADAPPEFALTSNLDGVMLRFDPLGWRLGAGTRGSLSVRGSLGNAKGATPRVDSLVLDAPGLKASGTIRIGANGTLERASFERVRAGEWLDAPLTLTGRGRGALPAVALTGGRLDLRNLPAQTSGAGALQGDPLPLEVALDNLQVTKDIALTRFRGLFKSQGGLSGSFTGNLNGKALVAGSAQLRGGKTAVRITADDAGAVISASGLLKSAVGGKLVLGLAPREGVGTYDGTLAITQMRLRDAPQALALLSAASGIGLLEQMDGGGLMFTEVDSRFRISPRTITVLEGSAVGPSIGVSVDGFYDVASKQIDMQGVVSPFFAINGIGSILTRKGEGLIGFNYTLDGLAAQPRVAVNPLSLFTPGMFREIFRRPAPQPTP